MKFTPDIGIGLKFDMIYFLGKSIFPWQRQTEKQDTQLNLNSTRIRFDVKKLTPVSETMVYCTLNMQE